MFAEPDCDPAHNALKIDHCFVFGMMQQERHPAVVSASILPAHTLGRKVVAKGFEAAEQARAVLELGCDEIQGFIFSTPLPANEFLRSYAGFVCNSFALQPSLSA